MMEKRMTLEELVAKFNEATVHIDDKADDILRRNPDILAPLQLPSGQVALTGKLGRLLAIGIMDFLCWAFDRPELGYIPPSASDDQS